MTIAKEFAAKLSVALVAVAMIFSAFASSASAQTTEELQQMINDLLAQVAQLQSQIGGDTGSAGTCMAPAQPLTIGSEGADVTALQNTLIAGGYSIPAGATGYFGVQTQSALAAWQAANAVSPAAGYYGPITKAALEAACAADDGDDTDGTDDSDDSSDDSDDGELEGEGTLEDVEIDNASDDEVEEGSEDAEVATVTLSAENGDIEIDRMSFTLDYTGTTTGDRTDEPWEAFETISLWVDGDMVGEFDAADEDEYLDEDDGTFRFSGLELVVREGEQVEVVVAATVAGSVDGVDLDPTWDISLDEIRYFDADGVASDEDISTDAAEFTIVEEGEGEELELASSSEEPDAETIVLDENDSTDGLIFAFELDADDSEGDIELNELTVDIEISSTTGAIEDVVEDFYVEIDGETFDAETYNDDGATTSVSFDIDGDVVIDAESTVTVMVYAEFSEMDSDSDYQGVTITASIDEDDVDAEGVDDINVAGTPQTGKAQTLRSEGITAEFNDDDSETDVNGNTATFTFVVDVTAVGDDAVLTAADFNYTVDEPATTSSPTVNVVLDADNNADEDPAGTFTIDDGETSEMTFTVYVTTDSTGDAGLYTVTLDDVAGDEVDESLDEVAQFSS